MTSPAYSRSPRYNALVNVESVDRIIYSIFQRFNLEWKTRTLSVFTQAAWRHPDALESL